MQTKFLVRSFLVLAILALGTVACGGTETTAEEETTATEDAATETSGSESSDETGTTTTDDTTDTTTPTDSNTATDTPTDDTDDDDDSVTDTADNCPLAANTDQADLDTDGAGDTCDDDDDGDADLDSADNCPLTGNADQLDTDTDGTGDACDDDDDGDADLDTADNCPLVANPDQTDTDADGVGDACDDAPPPPADDTDDDDDGVADTADNCPLVANPDQTDTDADGTGDACDEDTPPEETPTVAVTANTDTALNTETSTLLPTNSAFTVAYSGPLAESVNVADHVTLNCASVAQTFATSAAGNDADDGITNNEFVITPDAALPSGEDCTITVLATPVGEGTTSTTETAFLSNTCGLIDDFSDATSLDVCWTAGAQNADKLTDSIDETAGTATFTVAAGTTTTLDDSVSYSKVVNGANITLTGIFDSVEGLAAPFDTDTGEGLPDGVLLQALAINPNDDTDFLSIVCGVISNGGNGLTALFYDGTNFGNSPLTTEGTSFGQITISLVKQGADFTCNLIPEVGDPIALSGLSLTFDDPAAIEGGILFMHGSADTELKAVANDLTFTVDEAPVD